MDRPSRTTGISRLSERECAHHRRNGNARVAPLIIAYIRFACVSQLWAWMTPGCDKEVQKPGGKSGVQAR
jgi:hypothetical protein